MKQLTLANPHVIIMVGIPGAGKTAFAEQFAETFKTPYVNEGAITREGDLNASQSEKVTRSFLDELLKTRRTLVYEGSTTTKSDRQKLVEHIVKAGYTPLIVWVQTESVEAKRRALKKHPKGSGLSSQDFDSAVSSFQTPIAKEHATVISGKHTYATQLRVILKQLSSERPDLKLTPSRRPSPHAKRTMLQ